MFLKINKQILMMMMMTTKDTKKVKKMKIYKLLIKNQKFQIGQLNKEKEVSFYLIILTKSINT